MTCRQGPGCCGLHKTPDTPFIFAPLIYFQGLIKGIQQAGTYNLTDRRPPIIRVISNQINDSQWILTTRRISFIPLRHYPDSYISVSAWPHQTEIASSIIVGTYKAQKQNIHSKPGLLLPNYRERERSKDCFRKTLK